MADSMNGWNGWQIAEYTETKPVKVRKIFKSLAEASADLAERTVDAYSVDRYRSWRAVCRAALARMAYREAEAWVRSKHTRWAADVSGQRYGCVTGEAFARYLDRYSPEQLEAESKILVDGMTAEGFWQ